MDTFVFITIGGNLCTVLKQPTWLAPDAGGRAVSQSEFDLHLNFVAGFEPHVMRYGVLAQPHPPIYRTSPFTKTPHYKKVMNGEK